MKHLLHFLSLLLASAALLRPGESHAQGTAFSCDGTFYQIRQVGNTSQIFKVDRSSTAYTTTAYNIQNGSNDLGVLVNGLAYNPQDGYMYALSTPGSGGNNSYATINLYKIGQGGIVQVGSSYVTTGSNTALNLVVASGTFDKSGNYYFTSQNTGTGTAPGNYNVYRLQPTSSTPTVATQLTTTNSGNYTFYDIAYNPVDNNLYGTLNTGSLYKIVLSGGTSTAPTAATVTQVTASNTSGASPIGSAFFDVAGNMYGYSNGTTGTANSGGFYAIDLTSGTYTLISNIDPASVSDGASCINPGNAIDVTKEAINVKVINAYTFDISYAIRVRNTYTATDTYVQVSDLLKGNANNANSAKNVAFPTASKVTIITKPAVSSDNGATLVANANYTGLSGNAGLLDGNQSLTAGQEAVITYTVEVAFADANSVPTAAQNNTAYGTSTSTGANQGYTLTSTDVLVSPNNLIASDASSNSSNYPTLRSGSSGTPAANDTPAPTPITFAPSINGTVFEDVNYGGGAGRSQVASQGIGRSGARVELYNVAAGVATYSTFTTSAADGSYSFTGLTAGNSYLVRVVSNTVTSSRNAGSATGLVGVQTYRTSVDATNGTVADPNRVGGEYPARVEAGNGSTTSTIASLLSSTSAAESIANITLPGTKAPAVGVDFGYNFDTVVNTNDTGQGSLRQFITNANALQNSTTSNGTTTYLINQAAASSGGPPPAAGVETSIFMIPDGNAHDGLLAYNATSSPGTASQLQGAANNVGGTVAVITPASLLPAIGGTYGASTSIDGTTQTQNVGNTNNVALGAGGTVGTGATALSQVNGPEVQITGSSNLALGLDVASTGANTTLKGLSIYGFGNARDDDNNAVIRSAAAGLSITQSVIGSAATAFAAPSTLTNADDIRITSVNGGTLTISNNLIGFSNSKGIAFGPGQVGANITNNEIRSNGQGANGSYFDGLDIQGNTATVSGNLFINNGGQGVDSYNSNGYNRISGNTIIGNGGGSTNAGPSETAGVRIYGAGNMLNNNIIASNYGAGILVNSGASTTTISQNSIYNNGNVAAANGTAATGELGIDLLASSDNDAAGTSPFVTLNDNGDTDTGANGLLNFPVLTGVSVSSTALVVTGYARPGSLVELFLAQANPASVNATGANFGQGQSYLAARTEGSSDDTNSGTGTYGANGASTNGFNQGTDNTNLFTFSIPLSSLTAAQVKALQSGSAVLTSTATLSSATSEFSGNLAVSVGDVTVALNGPTTLYAGQSAGTYTASFTNEGPQAATNVPRVVTLPAGATATAAQAPGATIGTNASGNTTLTYPTLSSLALNATSTVQFSFTAPSTVSSLTLTATTSADSQGANAAPDQATLTLGTVATADVTAAVTATANATTGTITATFGNNGPQTAAGLTPTVQLPAGLTNLTVPSGWTYTASTGLLTYNTANSTLASGSSLSVTVTYPLSSAPSAPLTAVASVTTTTDEAGRTANNTAQAVMPTAFDLTTTLSGPASAITGSPMTLYVTTTNNGPNLASDATETVSIPSAASLANTIYITNGGTYSYNSGTGVGTVTFPKLTSVPAGQTVTNSITFPAPSANFAPSAAVSSTATETNTGNNTAYLNGAGSSTNVTVSSGSTLATENESTTITTPSTVVAPGAVVTYTVTSTNKGGAGATGNATVTEKVQLLPGLTASNLKVGSATGTTANGSTLLSFASAGGTSTYDPATGVLTYYQVTQAPGASTTYDAIAVTTPSAVGNDGQLVATATVSTNLNDNVPADNVASVGVRVATVPDVTTSISGPSSTGAGLPASYVVKFVNNGTTNAYGVTESAQLPAGLSGVSILDASGKAVSGASYSPGTGLVTLPSQSVLAAGTEQQYTLVLTAPAQTFPVSSAVASNTADGVATNNAANLTTTVIPNVDLAVSISGPTVAVVGNTVTYVVSTTNNGPTSTSNAAVTLRVPTGLTLVNSSNSGNSGGASSGPGTTAATASDNGDGTTTYSFPAGTILPGGNVLNYLSFLMPNASSGAISGVASVSSGSTDLVASNNTAALTTSIAPATTAQADLRTSITLNTSTTNGAIANGSQVSYNVAFRNAGDSNSAGTGAGSGSAAQNMVPTVNLPANLLATDLKVGGATGTQSGNIITFGSGSGSANGATYNVTTGLLTFPTIANAPAQTGANATYTVVFTAQSGNGSLTLVSEVASSTSDGTPASNFAVNTVTLSRVYDLTTALSGPATAQPGALVGYTVTTLNSGPSTAPGTTSQNVTGLTVNLGVNDLKVDGLTGTLANGVITFKNSAGTTVATYTQSSGTLNLADVTTMVPGAPNEVVHAISFPMPASGSVSLTANVSNTNNNSLTESNTNNNTATLTTTPANIAPVAQNVWNSLQSPRGNTATNLPISSLNATDADGSIAANNGYTITSLPASGTLYYNGTAITAANYSLTDPSKLSYKPTAGFAGDVTFTYTATDNGSTALTSPPANYTIMVAPDQSTAYATTPEKGGSANVYATNDVLAYVIDPNTASYNGQGLVYGTGNGTTASGTNPLLQAGAANGLPTTGTNAALAAKGNGPAASGNYPANPDNTLPSGVSLDAATGLIFVSDASKLPNSAARTYYQVNVITTDLNGGTNTTVVRFTLGALPLPVELVAFTAQAVQNRDALLKWTTASELHNDHFVVERSLDGVSFVPVGQVAGQGSKATSTDYSFTEAGIGVQVAAGQPVYYRLQQVDADGTRTYSPTRSVRFVGAAAVAVALYPNPATTATSLDLSALPATASYQVVLLDATGRQVRQATLSGGLVQALDLHELATGTYSVLVSGQQADGSALRQVLRLTKE